MKNDKNWVPCIRCGVCCIGGVCGQGEEGEDGVCIYLDFIEDNKTSCQLIVSGEMHIVGRDGCPARSMFTHTPGLFDKVHSNYLDRVKQGSK